MHKSSIYKDKTGKFLDQGKFIIKNIIKENSVNLSQSISVGGERKESDQTESANVHDHEIEPIIEDDEVVGVIHHCQCGKSTEIRFDY